MMYRARFYADRNRGHDRQETRLFGSRQSAEQWAREVLGTIAVTNDTYHRDLGRCGWVDVYSVSKPHQRRDAGLLGDAKVDTHMPAVVIVPSVGELGYW